MATIPETINKISTMPYITETRAPTVLSEISVRRRTRTLPDKLFSKQGENFRTKMLTGIITGHFKLNKSISNMELFVENIGKRKRPLFIFYVTLKTFSAWGKTNQVIPRMILLKRLLHFTIKTEVLGGH